MTSDDNKRVGPIQEVERSRSTPLRSVVWMTGVLVWATVVALVLRAPTWASIFLCTMTGISFLIFLAGYVYLFAADREALRVEQRRVRHGVETLPIGAGQAQEPDQGFRRYVGPASAGFAVAETDEKAWRVGIGDADRARAASHGRDGEVEQPDQSERAQLS